MTTNINIKFTVPSPMEVKKCVRDTKQMLNLKRRLMESAEDTKWLDERQQRAIESKAKYEADLAELLGKIDELKAKVAKLKRQLENAKKWMAKSDRDTSKDNKCLAFQKDAIEIIDAINNVEIPEIEAKIKKRNYDGVIQWNEKYIRNKPAQVLQRIINDCDTVVKRVESSVVDFHSIKGKEKHLLALKARLTKPLKIDSELSKYSVSDLSLEQRIANIESALAFRKLVDSRPNGQVLSKLAQEYFNNEQLEIDAICQEEWLNYLDRVYFKGGMDAFYI